MILKFYVPVFNFDYLGENKSLQDMFTGENDFHKKLKDYPIDYKYKMIIKKNESEELKYIEDIDIFSKDDWNKIGKAYWSITFECEEKELNDCKGKLNLLLLAFRIAKHSNISIKYIICKNDPLRLSSKYSDDWKYAITDIKEKIERQELNKSDLDEIISTYNNLKEFTKVSFRTEHAVHFLFLSYTSYYCMEVFMLLMTALETLVSPDVIGAIEKPVRERVVHLINDQKICSKNIFKKIYELRSDIIHGKNLVDINFDKELLRLQQLQKITLAVFRILLENNFKNIYKDETSKENFYKKLLNNQ